VYKIQHHLEKTGPELHEMNKLVSGLTDYTQKAIAKLDETALAWAKEIDRFMKRDNHSKCVSC
jgi:hypothetical protein